MLWILVAAAVLGGLWLYSRCAVRMIETAMPPAGEFVTVEGVAMHYIRKGAGRPVVLIHGSDGVLQDFAPALIDQLAAQYEVIAIDRPGHGYSGRPAGQPLTLQTNTRLIHGVVRALGLRQPLLVGHSYGGSTALRYALDYPDSLSALVLLAPGTNADTFAPQPVAALPGLPVLGGLVSHVLLPTVGALLAPAMNAPAFLPGPVPPDYLPHTRYSLRPAQFKAWGDEWRAFGPGLRELQPRWGEVQVPTAILAGAGDVITRPADHTIPLHQAIAGSTLTVVEGAGHALQYTHPDLVVAAVRALTERNATTAS